MLGLGLGLGLNPGCLAPGTMGPLEGRYCVITVSQTGNQGPEALNFLFMISQPELNLNPDPVSVPREPGG